MLTSLHLQTGEHGYRYRFGGGSCVTCRMSHDDASHAASSPEQETECTMAFSRDVSGQVLREAAMRAPCAFFCLRGIWRPENVSCNCTFVM